MSSNESKFIVYTCITNTYDQLWDVSHIENVRFVCFTNTKVNQQNGWEIQPLSSPQRLTSGHDINRFHKFFPHHLFPDYRYSIYLDGNISYKGDFHKLVSAFKSSSCGLGAFVHPDGRNLSEEFEACSKFGKFDLFDEEKKQLQLDHYQAEGFNILKPITANYFIIRDHSDPKLHDAMSLWWSHLFEFTKRDQTSSSFVIWKTGLKWTFLNDISIKADDLVRIRHRESAFMRLKRILKSKVKALLHK